MRCDVPGCSAEVELTRCTACDAHYAHHRALGDHRVERPSPWGPIEPALARRLDASMARCTSKQRDCACAAHELVRDVVLRERRTWPEPPTVTEAALREHLANLDQAVVEPALNLAIRVHGAQSRKDGTPYLTEHIFPVAVAVADYLAPTEEPPRVARAVAAALLHDALEDVEHAAPPMSLDELRAAIPNDVLRLIEPLTRPEPGSSRDYEDDLRRAPRLARVVKVFDRLNNVSCAHKTPAMVERYVEDTRAHYLLLARDVDPSLALELALALSWLQHRYWTSRPHGVD